MVCRAKILDLFDYDVVGWSVKPMLTSSTVMDVFAVVWFRRKPVCGIDSLLGLSRSVGGLQGFSRKLAACSMISSMTRKDNCLGLRVHEELPW